MLNAILIACLAFSLGQYVLGVAAVIVASWHAFIGLGLMIAAIEKNMK